MSRRYQRRETNTTPRLPSVFNLQGSELVIILLLALVVLGPEKLPDAMRKAGQFYAELKKMSSGFQAEFRAVVDEPLRELRETANTIRDSADFTKLQNGERPEKPKSGEMVAAADPDEVPTDDLPFAPDRDELGLRRCRIRGRRSDRAIRAAAVLERDRLRRSRIGPDAPRPIPTSAMTPAPSLPPKR